MPADQPLVQGLIAIGIVLFLIFIFWSKMEGKTIIDVLEEVKDFFKGQADG